MKKMPKNPFWRVFGPFLIYRAVQILAQILLSGVMVLMNNDKLAEVYSMLSEVPTDEEVQTALLNMSSIMMDVILDHYVEITVITALCTIPVMYYMFRKDRKLDVELNRPINRKAPAKMYVLILVLGIALCLGFNCLIIMTNLAFISDSYLETSALFYSASFLVQIIGIGIIVPIAEELLFRGIIFKRLRESANFMPAALITTVFFTMIHSNLPQMIYTFVLGMFLAYVYEKYGSFKAPAILHICVNIVSLVCTELNVLNLLNAIPMIMAVTVVICAFLCAVMYVLIRKIEEKPFSAEEEHTENEHSM